MSRVILVRHGHAAAGWDADLDPGLDDLGRRQAEAMAAELADCDGALVTSPLRRCRETADAIQRRTGRATSVEPAVGEIESPSQDLGERGAWLRGVMTGRWSEQAAELQHWRDRVLATVRALSADTIVVSHFVAINAVVGAATGDDRVVCFRPDNCSWTEVQVDDGAITVVQLGREASTEVR